MSIVIPAFNEEHRIGRTLDVLVARLDDVVGPAWEVIVSDDGSTDATAAVVAGHQAADHRIVMVRDGQNHGKGAAIVHGFRAARFDWVFVVDADLPISVDAIAAFLEVAGTADLVAGSRRLPASTISTPQPALRKMGGQVFLRCVAALGFGGFTDPQCGVKLLRRSAIAPIVDEAVLTRFAFDVELLTRCRQVGLRIVEQPVDWTHVEGSTLRPVRDAVAALSDLARLRRSLRVDGPATRRTRQSDDAAR